jgi:DNA-binding response OmpR family regulator
MSNVLIIDDSKQIHRLIRAELEAEEFVFRSAYSGLDGLELARRVRPDVILLDMQMPGISGLETCRRLAAEKSTSGVPVVFLSGTTSVPDKILCLNAGAIDYITKPYNTGELRARLRSAARRGSPTIGGLPSLTMPSPPHAQESQNSTRPM